MSAPDDLLDRWATLVGPSFNPIAPDAKAFRLYADALIALRVAEAQQEVVQEVWSEAHQMASRRYMERSETADEWREIAEVLGSRQSDLFDELMEHKRTIGKPEYEWLEAKAAEDERATTKETP